MLKTKENGLGDQNALGCWETAQPKRSRARTTPLPYPQSDANGPIKRDLRQKCIGPLGMPKELGGAEAMARPVDAPCVAVQAMPTAHWP
jgi:hypothetical protein